MKREYYINSTDEALITSDPRKSHNTMLFFGLMQNPSTKWKTFLYFVLALYF